LMKKGRPSSMDRKVSRLESAGIPAWLGGDKQETSTSYEIDPGQSAWYEQYKTQKNIPDLNETLLNTDPEPPLTDGFSKWRRALSLEHACRVQRVLIFALTERTLPISFSLAISSGKSMATRVSCSGPREGRQKRVENWSSAHKPKWKALKKNEVGLVESTAKAAVAIFTRFGCDATKRRETR